MEGLGVSFMTVGVLLQRCIPIAELANLREIDPQECLNRTMLFVLEDVAAFMRDKPICAVATANEDAMTNGETMHCWSEKASGLGKRKQLRIFGPRKLRNKPNAHLLRLCHPHANRERHFSAGQWNSYTEYLGGLPLSPSDCLRKKRAKIVVHV